MVTSPRLLGIIMVLAIAASGNGAATQPTVNRATEWVDPGGVDRANSIIGQCLERAAITPNVGRGSCVHSALDICIDQLGTAQRQLTDCAAFSRRAWETRLAAARTRLLSARTIDRRFGRAEPLIQRLRESERRWEAWNRADCELQTATSQGGSIHPMEMQICLSDHAANRAMELEALAEKWAKSFRL